MTALRPLQVPLEDITACFEGVLPSLICTVGPDGMPNVTYLSIVHRVDERHVALSRQFFKKTEENLQNPAQSPLVQLGVQDPGNGRVFSLDAHYVRTETSGPLFERMRTHLDAVAASEGMSNVFHLRGVDICEVDECVAVPCDFPEATPPRTVALERIEAATRRVGMAEDLDELLQATLESCRDLVGAEHGFVMLADETGRRLYTVASMGYGDSGAGSEIEVGVGLVGLAAARRQLVRLTHVSRDLHYAHAAMQTVAPDQQAPDIPLPGLPKVQSQLVAPMLAHRHLAGMLVLQSESIGAFQAADECLVGILCSQAATNMTLLSHDHAPAEAAPAAATTSLVVKYYPDDESVFLDNEYLIKGVAGGILWRLLRTYVEEGREEFSNRELRLDPTLDLPDIKDNLEARLILLRKRLEERTDALRVEKVARGRFRLVVSRPISLQAVGESSS